MFLEVRVCYLFCSEAAGASEHWITGHKIVQSKQADKRALIKLLGSEEATAGTALLGHQSCCCGGAFFLFNVFKHNYLCFILIRISSLLFSVS